MPIGDRRGRPRAARSTGWAALAIAVLAAAVTAPAARSQGVVVERDLPYRAGAGASSERQRLDLYLPPGQGWPLAVVVHGGDWRSGARRTAPGARYDNVARALAERGIGVALVGYRVTDGGLSSTRHPGHAEDVAAALAHARALLVARGARPGATVLVGHEAGAHLAALLATNPRFLAAEGLSPDAVVGVVGLSGTYRVDPVGTDDADVFGPSPGARLDASPYHQVAIASAAPEAAFLLVVAQTEHDGLAEEAEAFDARLAARGAETQRRVVPRDHDGLVDRIGLPGDATTEALVAFILGVRDPTPAPSASPTPPPSATATAVPTATATPVDAVPPSQAATGPGGRARAFAEARHGVGVGGAYEAWWPDGAPDDGAWPVVVFLADAAAQRVPADYARWLEHVARGGRAVVAPVLDAREPSPAARAASAVATAIGALAGDGVPVDGAWRAYAGDGSGGDVAVELAAGWYARALPPPRVVLAIAPDAQAAPASLAAVGRLPADALGALVTRAEGERDALAEDRAWRALGTLPGRRRAHLVLRSDRYGQPPLAADRATALTDGPDGRLDALDWYGTWRWLDALLTCRALGRWCDHVLEDPDLAVDLGRWADGRPVAAAALGRGVPRSPWLALPWGRR